MRDIFNNLDFKRGISPTKQTNADTALVSQIQNMQGVAMAVFVLDLGAVTDTDVTFTVLAEEGDISTLSDNTAVADTDMLGTELLATPLLSSDDKVFKLGFLPSGKQYKRVTVTPSGNNSGDINIAGTWVTLPLIAPSANPPA